MTNQTDSTLALLKRLSGTSNDIEFENIFEPGHVSVSLGQEIANLPQAQLTFSFVINLLTRLHPIVQRLDIILPMKIVSSVVFPRWHDAILSKHIKKMLKAIKSPVSYSTKIEKTNKPQVGLVIGKVSTAALQNIFIGSEGWEVNISPDAPVNTGKLINPIGAFAAGAMGVGEVWKRLLLPHKNLFSKIPIIPINETLKFSCFTYESDFKNADNPPLKKITNLGDLTIVGLGAGGGATMYALASLPKLEGKLNIIEPDEVILPNLNRYIFADEEDGYKVRKKTDVISDLLNHHKNLDVIPYPDPFNVVAEKLAVEDYQQVISAVHSRAARRSVQFETPEVLWDAGATEDGDFIVWRIEFGHTECMLCKHPDDIGDAEDKAAIQLRELLGFDKVYWNNKNRDNTTFSSDDIRSLSQVRESKNLEFDLPEKGERFSDWYKNQCGRLLLSEIDQEVPIPFAPVMAGILMAGEVIKEREFPSLVLSHYYGNTLVGNWMRKNIAQSRQAKIDCSCCQNKVFQDQFERRWISP